MLLCGGALPGGHPPARRRRSCCALPPLGVGADGGFVSHDPRYSLERGVGARGASASSPPTARVRPAVVLVELFPFGRAKFARELVPLLEAARADGALDRLQPARHPRQRAAPTSSATTTAPPRSPTRTSTPCSSTATPASRGSRRRSRRGEPLRVPVHYTGFVVREGDRGPPRRAATHVVVSAGGGLVGEPLLRAAAEAQPAAGVPLRLIGGPLLPDAAWQRLRALAGRGSSCGAPSPTSAPSCAPPARRSARAATTPRSRSSAPACPALLVPVRDAGGGRADRAARGGSSGSARVRVLAPERLAPATLAAELRRLLAFEPRPASVDLDGARADRRSCSRTCVRRRRRRGGPAHDAPPRRMLRPHVVRRWKALAGAGARDRRADRRRPRQAVAAGARRRPLLAHRTAPFTLDAADVRLLAAVAAVVLAIALVEAGAQYASDLWLQAAGERISHDLRVRVYEHLQRLSLGFHQQRQKGDLVTRVTGDVNAMGDLFSQSLGAMVQAALLSRRA